MKKNTIYEGNCLEVIKTFPNNSVDCIVTSPPYWGPREYGTEKDPPIWYTNDEQRNCEHDWMIEFVKGINGGTKSKKVQTKGQDNFQKVEDAVQKTCKKCGTMQVELGREKDVEDYIEHLMMIIDECMRVLKKHGTFWLNIGDTYRTNGPMRKSLTGVPQRVMLKMMDRGWLCRNDIIWYKPNAMPHPVKDRFTPDFEHIYQFHYFPFFAVDQVYYFNQILEPLKVDNAGNIYYGGKKSSDYGPITYSGNEYSTDSLIGKNMRTVWKIPTANLKEAHFAAFPIELASRAIDAGCPREICKKCGEPRKRYYINGKKIHDEIYNGQSIKDYEGTGAQDPSDVKRRILESLREKYEKWSECECGAGYKRGIVLDPFMGSGTTAIAALQHDVDFVGIEYYKRYIDIALKRISDEFPNYKTRGAMIEL